MIRRNLYRLAPVASIVLFFALPAAASVQYRVDDAALSQLAGPTKIGGKLKVANVPLVDGEEGELELERFDVWADGADIKVFGAGNEVVQRLPLPAAKYYRGRVAGKPDSLVFIAVSGRRVDGLVYTDDRKFALGTERRARGSEEMNLVVQESSVMDDIPLDGHGFECGVEKTSLNNVTRPRAVTNALGEAVSNVAPAGTQRSVINLAIDTDYELYTKAGSNPANVTTYIGNLIAAVSTIYERDLRTEVRIAYLGIQNNIADPFLVVPGTNGQTSLDALFEVGDRWHNTPPSANSRSAATLISGKAQLAGIAWVGTLCTNDFSYSGHWGGKYSYNGGVTPPASLAVPDPNANPNYTAPSSNYWPLLQVAHELGHNVGSDHTHCITLTASQQAEYAVTRNFVDECYNLEGGCFSGTQLVPAEKGSIMSYCHLRSPGYGSNTRFTFGKAGETSEIALNGLIASMAGVTPALSSITAPATINVGASAAGSILNAGLTYSWTIANGTFTGGGTTATGANVTFTGTANPLTLTVTATNASGCAVTDTKTITVQEQEAPPVPPAPATVVASASATTSVLVTWSASAGATEYQVWRSSNNGAFTLVSSAGGNTFFTDSTAAPNTAYRYSVRAGNESGFSALGGSDLVTTVVFTDPSLLVAATRVKLVHFTELLTAVNAVRSFAGLSPIAFTAPSPSTAVTLRRQHLLDLRAGLDAARSAIGLSAISYVDPTVTAGSTTVKAMHITQLRDGVK
ncbi:MAG TPA: M12 family metallo-peptidase [Thermoanaerobaculia bacterium]